MNNNEITLLVPLSDSDIKIIANACNIIDSRNELVKYNHDIDREQLIDLYRKLSICLFMIDHRVAMVSKDYGDIEQCFTAFDDQEHNAILNACKIVDKAIGNSKSSNFVDHLKERVKSFSEVFNTLDLMLKEHHERETKTASKVSKTREE